MESGNIYRHEDYLIKGVKFLAYRESANPGGEPEHTHNFLELIYVISGSSVHYVDGVRFEMSKGDLLIIDTNQTHSFTTETGMLYANMILLPEFISETIHSNHTALDVFAYCLYNSEELRGDGTIVAPLVSFHGNDLIEADAIIGAMCDEMLNENEHYAEVVSNYLNIIFYLISRNIAKKSGGEVMHDIRAIIPDIIADIENDCSDSVSMKNVAAKYFYSPAYFSRAFKKYFGTSFSSYVQKVRVQKILLLLEDPTVSIEEISERVGFGDQRELYRTFKKVTGTTPGNYRKQKKII